MIQHIITLIIVALAVGRALYQIARFFKQAGKDHVCSCASCPMAKSKKMLPR